MIRLQHRTALSRRGISRVEVIVVLVACLLLAMLFAPAVPYQRRRARGLHCLNNIRQVGLALHNAAASTGGNLPALTGPLKTGSASEQEELSIGWPITILPALDAVALLRQIKQNIVVESGRVRIGDAERAVVVSSYICPQDVASHDRPGRLSYVVNTGFISQRLYHGDPDREHVLGSLAWGGTPLDARAEAIHAATGVMWNSNSTSGTSLDYVSEGDGASTTLLIAENLQAGHWYDTDTARIGFGFPVSNTDGIVPMGEGTLFESMEKPLNTQFDGGILVTDYSQQWRINRDLKAKIGTLPRPSSSHAGGANVIMCDGSGRFLNENIDPHVYLRLLTSNGAIYGEGELQSDY